VYRALSQQTTLSDEAGGVTGLVDRWVYHQNWEMEHLQQGLWFIDLWSILFRGQRGVFVSAGCAIWC